MKKSLLFLTLLISISGIASLQATVSWKRAWACRNMHGWASSDSTRERLYRNKCTDEERVAGNNLMDAMAIGGYSLAVLGAAGAGLAAGEAEARKKESQEFEMQQQEGWKAIEGKPESPIYGAPEQ